MQASPPVRFLLELVPGGEAFLLAPAPGGADAEAVAAVRWSRKEAEREAAGPRRLLTAGDAVVSMAPRVGRWAAAAAAAMRPPETVATAPQCRRLTMATAPQCRRETMATAPQCRRETGRASPGLL